MAEEDGELEDGELELEDGVESDVEEGEARPQMKHSWSRISMFQSCPQMYKLMYIDKKKGDLNPMAIIGQVCHDAVHLYNDHCIKNNITSDFDKWKEFAWQAIERSRIDPNYNDEIFKLVEQYAQSHEIDLEAVVGAEEKIAINRAREQVEWDSPEAWMRLAIDYLQISGNIAKITDYKTTWAMKSDPFQLKIYAWAIKQVYPHVTDFQIEIDYLRHEFQKDTTFNESDIADIERAIIAKTTAIENETKFEPCVGSQCAYCPVWYACPAMKTMGEQRRFAMPKTKEEATALALELEKHSRLATEAKKTLKEYCNEAGGLVAGGRQFQFNSSVKYTFDIPQMIIKLKDTGLNLLEYLTVDYRKFKVLLKNETVFELVKKYGEKKVSVKFSNKKAGSKEETE